MGEFRDEKHATVGPWQMGSNGQISLRPLLLLWLTSVVVCHSYSLFVSPVHFIPRNHIITANFRVALYFSNFNPWFANFHLQGLYFSSCRIGPALFCKIVCASSSHLREFDRSNHGFPWSSHAAILCAKFYLLATKFKHDVQQPFPHDRLFFPLGWH